MKTAIELLVEYYEELVPGIENVVIDKFLDLEKQQIIDAYEKDMDSNGNLTYESGLEYYASTFTTNKETLK